MNVYRPEGMLIDTPENKQNTRSISALELAMEQEKILEARALVCDSAHNLIVDLGCCKGIIPRGQTALGIEDGTMRDIAIISRVNKPVCFMVVGFEQKGGEVVAVLSQQGTGKMPPRIRKPPAPRGYSPGDRHAFGKFWLLCGRGLRDQFPYSD